MEPTLAPRECYIEVAATNEQVLEPQRGVRREALLPRRVLWPCELHRGFEVCPHCCWLGPWDAETAPQGASGRGCSGFSLVKVLIGKSFKVGFFPGAEALSSLTVGASM